MTRRSSCGLAGTLAVLSFVALPAGAVANEGLYERNGADRVVSGLDNGNTYAPSAVGEGGTSASDVTLAALGGLALAGGIATAVVVAGRRQEQLPRPA